MQSQDELKLNSFSSICCGGGDHLFVLLREKWLGSSLIDHDTIIVIQKISIVLLPFLSFFCISQLQQPCSAWSFYSTQLFRAKPASDPSVLNALLRHILRTFKSSRASSLLNLLTHIITHFFSQTSHCHPLHSSLSPIFVGTHSHHSQRISILAQKSELPLYFFQFYVFII